MKTGKVKTSRQRKGSALPLVLMIIVVLLLTGSGLFSMGLQSRLLAIRTIAEIKARCAADAGLAKALFDMNQQLKSGWNGDILPEVSNEPLLYCDATFSYNVTNNRDGTYTMNVTGKSGSSQREVICTLTRSGPAVNPVGHWAFDEGTGNTAYDSVSGKNGTIHGADWTSSGKTGNALNFDGRNDYVDLRQNEGQQVSSTYGDAVTIGAWVKPDPSFFIDWGVIAAETQPGHVIDPVWRLRARTIQLWFFNQVEFKFDVRVDGRHRIDYETASVDMMVDDFDWMYVTANYDRTDPDKDATISIEIAGEGNSDTERNVQPWEDIHQDDNVVSIGGRDPSFGGLACFNGYIDEVSIFDDVLTGSELIDSADSGEFQIERWDEK